MPISRNKWEDLRELIKFRHPQHLHKYPRSLQRDKIHEIPIKVQGGKIHKNAEVNPYKVGEDRSIQGNVPRVQPMGRNRS